MNLQDQIVFISSQPEPKRSDMQELHRIVMNVLPECKLWFLDGINGKISLATQTNAIFTLWESSFNLYWMGGIFHHSFKTPTAIKDSFPVS